MTEKNERRIFIGGMVKTVTEDELREKFSRFGSVGEVEIKTRNGDIESKTFAYLNLTAEENDFKKCFTAYNNCKWKGGQLKLQFAKESFLTKLKQERQAAAAEKEAKACSSPPVWDSLLEKKAVPGTAMNDSGTWVMGKYNRVLPVLHMKKPGSKKMMTLDPSKTMHSLKRLKQDDADEDPGGMEKLTWQLEEKDSEMTKRRKGQFPAWEPPKKQSIRSRLLNIAAEEYVSDVEMEVVPVQHSLPKPKPLASSAYDSSSSDSSDTDDIVHKASTVKSSTKKSPDVPSKSKTKVKGKKGKSSTPADSILSRRLPENGVSKSGSVKSTPTSTATVSLRQLSTDESDSDQDSASECEATKEGKLKKVANKSLVTSQCETPPFRGLSMLSSDDEHGDIASSFINESLGAVSSQPAKRKRSRSDTSEDSDLDDNDFEAVGKKLAARAEQQQQQKQPGKNVRREQRLSALPLASCTPSENLQDKPKTKCKEPQTDSMSHIQKSHKARKENMTEVIRQESLVTKAIREGAGSKRIVFSSDSDNDEQEERQKNIPEQRKQEKMSLFKDSDSESEEEKTDFSVRPQFHGEKGRKLMELQSKVKDKRFRFDERFAESDSEAEVPAAPEPESENELAEEKSRNLRILTSVLGYSPKQRIKMEIPDMRSMRYIDPVRSKHLEIKETPAENVSQTRKGKVTPKKADMDSDKDSNDSEEDMDDKDSNDSEEDMDDDAEDEESEKEDSSDEDDSGEEEKEKANKDDNTKTNTGKDANRKKGSKKEETVGASHKEEQKSDEVKDFDYKINVSSKLGDVFTGGSSFTLFGSNDNSLSDAESEEKVTVHPPALLFESNKAMEVVRRDEEIEEDDKEGKQEEESSEEEEQEKDSSEEEEQEKDSSEEEEPEEENSDSIALRLMSAASRSKKQPSFLISKDDPRLIAAVKFFKRPPEEEFERMVEGWPDHRREIMQIVRERHKRALRKKRKAERQELWKRKHVQHKKK